MQEINEWINGTRDFDAGVALYIKYGDNSFLKDTLTKFGETPYTLLKLTSELEGLAPDPPEQSEDTNQKIKLWNTPPHPETDGAFTAPDPKDTERFLSLKELLRTKYRQLDHNRAALAVSSSKEYRHLTAKQILSLYGNITDIHRLMDHFNANGSFPQVRASDEAIRTPTERRQLLWVSISKAKRRIKEGKCRNIHQTEQLIQKNTLRLAQLKEAEL